MPKEFTSFKALISAIKTDVAGLKVAFPAAMADIAHKIETDAKDKIGTYQAASGPFKAWAPLAQSTIDRKDSALPLIVDGTMRDSITSEHGPNWALIGVKAGIPSSGKAEIGDIAAYQEFGTDHIPPRPFLGPALHENHDFIIERLGLEVVRRLKE